MDRGKKIQGSAAEGSAPSKRESQLDVISKSLAGLIELSKTRLELEIKWRDEDRIREDDAELRRSA